jgi:hypothetical protein
VLSGNGGNKKLFDINSGLKKGKNSTLQQRKARNFTKHTIKVCN